MTMVLALCLLHKNANCVTPCYPFWVSVRSKATLQIGHSVFGEHYKVGYDTAF